MFSDAWIPLLSALATGALVRIIDHTYHRGERTFDDSIAIRKELRDEVHTLHAELKLLQQELERWKNRFFSLNQQYSALVLECQALREVLDELRQHDDLRSYQQFQRALIDLRESGSEVSHDPPDMPSDVP
jgi:predicted nuclease with TOPRIM domain